MDYMKILTSCAKQNKADRRQLLFGVIRRPGNI